MSVVESSYLVVALITGASLGSFSCTIADRLLQNESISNRSRCNTCGHALDALSLTPVLGYVIRLGRCSYCLSRIPVAYPLVEVTLGSIVLAAFVVQGFTVSGLQLVILAWMITTCTLTDLRYGKVPNGVVAVGCVLGIVLLIFVSFDTTLVMVASSLLSGGAGLAVRLTGCVFLGKPGMGFGDVKLFAASGLLSGMDILLAIWIGIVAAAIVGLVGLLTRRSSRTSTLPFVPFFALGVLASKTVYLLAV